MIATVDNPSNAVEWALAEMMNKPEVMRKAIDELDRVVGRDRLVQESDVRGLNYLKACIREAFRLHPYHPFNPPRVAMADTSIAGYSIPMGSQIILSRVGSGGTPWCGMIRSSSGRSGTLPATQTWRSPSRTCGSFCLAPGGGDALGFRSAR